MLAFVGNGKGIGVINPDGTGYRDLIAFSYEERTPAWSPDGTKIAFISGAGPAPGVHVVNSDGTGDVRLTTDSQDWKPSWSPDGTKIVFERNSSPWVMNADGTNQTPLPNVPAGGAETPAWGTAPIAFPPTASFDRSPSQPVTGETVTFTDSSTDQDGTISSREWDLDNDGEFDDASGPVAETSFSTAGSKTVRLQVVDNDGYKGVVSRSFTVATNYPRPGGAALLRVPLVPAFRKCLSPDVTHTPPLAYTSCSSPDETSRDLTISNIGKSAASARFQVIAGNASTPEDEADVLMSISATDVKDRVRGSDYIAELQANFGFRLTDIGSGGPQGGTAATVIDTSLSFTVPCTGTSNPSIGSTCSIATTADAQMPGLVREQRRAIWQLGTIQLFDGGEDGEAETTADNTLFLRQGLFTP